MKNYNFNLCLTLYNKLNLEILYNIRQFLYFNENMILIYGESSLTYLRIREYERVK